MDFTFTYLFLFGLYIYWQKSIQSEFWDAVSSVSLLSLTRIQDHLLIIFPFSNWNIACPLSIFGGWIVIEWIELEVCVVMGGMQKTTKKTLLLYMEHKKLKSTV